jgi:pimeloyl-ACP methyl ester carboxylesterase
MGGIAAAVAAGAGDVDDVVLVAPALIPPRLGVKPNLNPNPKPVSLTTALCGALGRFATAVAVYAVAPFLKLFLRKIVRSATFWRRGLSKAVGRKCAPVFFTEMSWADGYRRPSCVKGWDDGMVRVVLAAATAGVNDVWAAESAKVAAAMRKESPATCDALEDMSTDAAATLDALRCSGARVLIVHGDEDAIVPLENSRRLAQALEGGDADVRLVVMRGCGHMPHEEDPDVFVEAVKSFVGEWNPRPTVRAKKP